MFSKIFAVRGNEGFQFSFTIFKFSIFEIIFQYQIFIVFSRSAKTALRLLLLSFSAKYLLHASILPRTDRFIFPKNCSCGRSFSFFEIFFKFCRDFLFSLEISSDRDVHSPGATQTFFHHHFNWSYICIY